MNHARLLWLAVLAAITGLPAPAAAAEDWQHTVVVYGMGAAIDGTAQIGDLEVPVNVSISELFDALEMGGMLAYRAENDLWSVTADATYMALGGTAKSDRGLIKGDLDVDQATLMGTLGRRLGDNVELLFSLGYFDLSTKLALSTRNPLTGVVTTRRARRDASWIDPLLGLQYNLPVGSAWRFNLRGDVGGFGVGSDLSYHVLANFRWQASDRFGVLLGYRLIGFDYEDGKGRHYQHYDLTEQGPLVGLTISF